MRRRHLFSLIIILIVVLSGCIFFQDTASPVFLNTPSIKNFSKITKANDDIIFDLHVQDNSGINYVSVYADGIVTPIATPIGDGVPYSKKEYKGEISVKAPYISNSYGLTVKVYDINGNPPAVKTLDRKLNTPDRTKPSAGTPVLFSLPARGSGYFELISQVSDIGSGISRVRFNIDDKIIKDLKVVRQADGLDDYVLIQEETTSWMLASARTVLPLVVGDHNIKIEVFDKAGFKNVIEQVYTIRPDGVLTTPDLVHYAPVFVEPGDRFVITLSASDSINRIRQIELSDNFSGNPFVQSITPSEAFYEKTITRIAPTREGEYFFTAKALNVAEVQKESSFKIIVQKNQIPRVSLSVSNASPTVNEKINITIDAWDDIGLSLVEVFDNGDSIAKYGTGSFKLVEDLGWVLQTTHVWSANKGRHTFTAKVIDKSGLTSEFILKQKIQVEDTTPPIVDNLFIDVRVDRDPNNLRTLKTHPTFNIKKNDRIYLSFRVTDPESEVKSVKYTLKPDGLLPTREYTAVSDDGYIFNTALEDYYDLPDIAWPNNKIYITVTTENIGGYKKTYENFATIFVSADKDVYKPKISLRIDPAKGYIFNSINILPSYSDEGYIKNVSLAIYKLNQSNEPIKISDGQQTELNMPANPDGSLDLTKSLNTKEIPENKVKLTWLASDYGRFVAVARAENDLGIQNSQSIVFDVQGVSLIIRNPTEAKVIDLGRNDLEYLFHTTKGATATVMLIYDKNGDNNYDEPPTEIINLDTSKAKETQIPEVASTVYEYSGSMSTADLKRFPNTGKYRVKVISKVGKFEVQRYSNINVRDTYAPVLKKNDGLLLVSKNIRSVYPKLSEGMENGTLFEKTESTGLRRYYYIPIDFKAGKNNTDVDITIKALDYGNITKAEYYIDSVLQPLPELSSVELVDSQADAGAKQRMFTYKATIPKDKLSYQVKELKIKLYDVEHPDGIEEIFYVKGVEIEKPVLNEFKVNFSEGPSDLKELTINKSDTGTFSISAGGEYKVSITNIDFSDNLYIGAVVLKIFDNDRNTEKTLKTWTASIDSPQIKTPISFEPDGLSSGALKIKMPDLIGNYTLKVELLDKTYLQVKGTKFENDSQSLNRDIAEFKVNVIDTRPLAVSLKLENKTYKNDMRIISSPFNLYINAQGRRDMIETSSIKVNMVMPDGTTKVLDKTELTPIGEELLYSVGASTLRPGVDKDGVCTLYINYATKNRPSEIKKSPEYKVVLDLNQNPYIGDIVMESTSGRLVLKSTIANTLSYDIDDVVLFYKPIGSGYYKSIHGSISANEVFFEIGVLSIGRYDYYVRVTDKSGRTRFSPDKQFSVDSKTPTIDNFQAFGNNTGKFSFRSADTEKSITARDSYGISKILVEAYYKDDSIPKDYSYIKIFTASSPSEAVFDKDGKSVKILTKAFQDNLKLQSGKPVESYTMTVTVFNTQSLSKSFSLMINDDDLKPSAAVFSLPLTGTIISESNYGQNEIRALITENTGISHVTLEISHPNFLNADNSFKTQYMQAQESYSANQYPYSYKITNLHKTDLYEPVTEGEFDVTIHTWDLAGNTQDFSLGKIIVDLKPPVIQSFTLNNPQITLAQYNSSDEILTAELRDFTISNSQAYIIIDTVQYDISSLMNCVGDTAGISFTAVNLKNILGNISSRRVVTFKIKVIDGAGHETVYRDNLTLVIAP